MSSTNGPKPKAGTSVSAGAGAGVATRSKLPASSVAAYALSLALLVAGALVFTQYIRAAGIQLEKKEIYAPDGLLLRTLPTEFPTRNARWRARGTVQEMSQEVRAELGSDNFITRWYEFVGDEPIEGAASTAQDASDERDDQPVLMQLHAVYYTGMIDTVPHVPERCFVGGGLVAGESKIVDVPLDMSRLTRDVMLERDWADQGLTDAEIEERRVWTARAVQVFNRVRLPRGVDDLRMNVTEFTDEAGETVYAGYFFVTNGEVVPTAEQVRVKGFNMKADYAYYMKVQFLGVGLDSAEELAAASADILNDLFPEIMRRAPDWIEVEEGRYPEPSIETDDDDDAASASVD